MTTETVGLREASKLEIISLMDNTVDFISVNRRKEVQSFRHWTRERYKKEWVQAHSDLPFAEHGLSMLIRVSCEKDAFTFLFDVGVSSNGVIVNAERMGIDLAEVGYVVLSHGHYDHFGGLSAIVKAVGKIDLPIIAHDDMARRRAVADFNGEIREYPTFPKPEELAPAKIISTRKPQLIASDFACITGEIPRVTSFEKGLTHYRICDDNAWQPDSILDERALIVNVASKGLVIISGCAHAGIINTILYAQQITGISKVYAVLGGFHLAGKDFERRIEPTVEGLRRINPELIIPSHCTGLRALCYMAQALPHAFVTNSVGNIYHF